MRNRLLTQLILDKINKKHQTLFENKDLWFLVEDRIPSLITKYLGMKEVPLENIAAHHIVGGQRPPTRFIRKLSSEHDMDWTQGFGSVPPLTRDLSRNPQESHRQMITHLVNKIAEVDPTPSKEYTARMLHWYDQSSNLPKGTGVRGDTYRGINGQSEEDVMAHEIGFRYGMTLPGWNNPDKRDEYIQKGLRIHAQQKEAKEKEYNEKHSSYIDFRFRSEDFGRAREALGTFHRVKHLLPAEHRDINKINSLHHLEDIVEPYKTHEPENEQDKRTVAQGSDIIHEDDDVRVHYIKNQEASCILGRGTRWCTAARENNQFENYNSTSPLIMITDKKGVLANRTSSSRNRRFQFHFGRNRSTTNIASREPEIGGHEQGDSPTDHSLMDETDSPFDYHELVGKFPQLLKIPHLQHLHSVMFQEKPLAVRRKEAATDAGFEKIMKHIKDYAPMQRTPREYSGIPRNPVTPHHDYLTSLLPKSNPRLGEFKQVDVAENHPIMRHFFGDKHNPPTQATHHESTSFLRTMLARKISPPSHAIESMFKHNVGVNDPKDITLLADMSDSPRAHELAYDALQSREVGHVHSDSRNVDHYTFLRKTPNVKLLERVHNDLKRSPARDSSTTNTKYFNNTIAHAHIAANPNTPTHVLEDIIRNKPMHGFHEEEGKEDVSIAPINPLTGTFFGSSQHNTHMNSMRRDRAGIIALNNLLMREDAKKAKVKRL
jgi:hypothetical protein